MLALTAEIPDLRFSEWTTAFPAGRSVSDVITHVEAVTSILLLRRISVMDALSST
jgi:hypothetical protein